MTDKARILSPILLLSGFVLLGFLLSRIVGNQGGTLAGAFGNSIPRIANLGQVQIGSSTQEDLAQRWGEGKVVVGGHPNSGRIWRVKDSPWAVHTDGFEYSKRGLVVDALEINEAMGRDAGAPEARLGRAEFAWLSAIELGMKRDQVKSILKAKRLAFTSTNESLHITLPGFQRLVQSSFRDWTVGLEFADDHLSRLVIGAQ
jgi:hypothetical protein